MIEYSIDRLADDLYAIDAWMEESPQRLACYLFDTPERVLVEVGPSATLHHLTAALEELGIDDLATIVVTHIHIDHAGGAGQLAAAFPNARIGVHSRGARHLADPDRLWSSAVRVFGEDWLTSNWGPMVPIDEDRLLVLNDGDEVPLGGGRTLEALYTPGHAKHHITFYDQATGGMFVGDSLGLCYPHGHAVQPVTPPPDFDPVVATQQMHRMGEIEPSFLGFAHFGPNYQVSAALEASEARLWEWVRFVEGLTNLDDYSATEQLRSWSMNRLRSEGYSEENILTYDQATYWPMQVRGIRHWMASRAD
ncbi:MAG: MBL fold metallo-hydrolase [Acidimicrobiia bacterium]|nr:MBL fold metallo-hydrolase [Acidimicrobiia bacterium]